MPKESAGLLLYRISAGRPEVLLGHPGGPFWAKKDAGAWSIPKGEFAGGEAPAAAAVREFREETGGDVAAPLVALGTIKQRGGKIVHGFAAAGDLDPSTIRSNTLTLEWPPRSGRSAEFPEIDRAAWFPLDVAAEKIHPDQREFLRRLEAAVPVR